MKKSLLFLTSICCLCLLNGCGSGGASTPPPPVATHFSVTADSSTQTAGMAFNITVAALDGSNGIVSNYAGTVHFSSSDAQAVLPANTTLTNGTGTFSATLKTVGGQTITASDSGKASIIGTSNSISVIALVKLSITSGAPPSGTVGVGYGPSSTEYLECHWMGPIFLTCTPCPSQSACAGFTPCRGFSLKPCSETKQVFAGFTFSATGGVGAYILSWAAQANSSLPPGLNLAQDGKISGTPTSPGPYNVIVTVTDSGSPAAQVSANYTITIAPPPPPATNAAHLLPIGTLGSPYVGFTFTATGGGPPLTWSETGALPQGMSLSTDGVLSGKPSDPGSYPIMVMVQDSFGQAGSPVPLTLRVLTQGFLPTGSMGAARVDHTATLLSNAKVLVAGGASDTADVATTELFDPIAGSFSPTGSMETTRASHTATLLSGGKVLVTGGYGGGTTFATAELFDPTSGTFASTGSMETARVNHTATLLSNGKVLVAGGYDASGNVLATAELFDPTSGTFAPTGSMEPARVNQTATLLSNGKVLVAGGYDASGNVLATAELFDPTSGTFAPTGSMETSRVGHTSTLLSNGRVLVAGGYDANGLATAELFDPTSGTFAPTGSMGAGRYLHTATLLTNGQVLVAGGLMNAVTPLSAAELFDPTSGTFTATADMTATRYSQTATLLTNGQVLVTGGQATNGGTILATAELYQ